MDTLNLLKQEMMSAYTDLTNLVIDINAETSENPLVNEYQVLHDTKEKLLKCCHDFLEAVMNNNDYDDLYKIDINYAGELQSLVVSIGEDNNIWIEFPDESYCEDKELDPFDMYNIAMIIAEDIEL